MLSKLSVLKNSSKALMCLKKPLTSRPLMKGYTGFSPSMRTQFISTKMFSTHSFGGKNEAEEVMKIETHPYLFVDICTNEYQQKFWAKKLGIEEEFVHDYFNAYKIIADASGDSATAFDPKNFGKDTPEVIIKEYMKAIEENLIITYNSLIENGEDIEVVDQILHLMEAKSPKVHPNMPKFQEYRKDNLTDGEKLEKDFEKDVFEYKLSIQDEELVDKILSKYTKESLDHQRIGSSEQFKTIRATDFEKSVTNVILADRALKNPLKQDENIDNLKGDLFNYLSVLKHEGFQDSETDTIEFMNYINNSIRDKILVKREILAKKLNMLEQVHKTYQQLNQENHSLVVSKANNFDFIAKYNLNESSAKVEKSRRDYKGQSKDLHQMETIALQLQNGFKDEGLSQEFVKLDQKLQTKSKNTVSYHQIKMKYALGIKNAAQGIESFEN